MIDPVTLAEHIEQLVETVDQLASARATRDSEAAFDLGVRLAALGRELKRLKRNDDSGLVDEADTALRGFLEAMTIREVEIAGVLVPVSEGQVLVDRDDLRIQLSRLASRLRRLPIAAGADDSADTLKKIPKNPDVLGLCKKLSRESGNGKSENEIAREYTGGNERKAMSLLRSARRYRHLWKSDRR